MRGLPFSDLLANNADRKAGHCLLGGDGRIWSVDHGLILNAQFKVRTVMIEFWGKRIAGPLVDDMKGLLAQLDSGGEVAEELAGAVAPPEIEALAERLRIIVDNPVLPTLDPYHNVPWPWV